MFSAGKGEYLFFNGTLNSNRLVGSVDIKDAVDVYAEVVTGGVRFFFMNGSFESIEAKKLYEGNSYYVGFFASPYDIEE